MTTLRRLGGNSCVFGSLAEKLNKRTCSLADNANGASRGLRVHKYCPTHAGSLVALCIPPLRGILAQLLSIYVGNKKVKTASGEAFYRTLALQ